MENSVPHLVPQLLHIVDLLQGNHGGCETVAQLGQQHSIPEVLLQLHGGRKLLLQAGLHPAEGTRAREHLLTRSDSPRSSFSHRTFPASPLSSLCLPCLLWLLYSQFPFAHCLAVPTFSHAAAHTCPGQSSAPTDPRKSPLTDPKPAHLRWGLTRFISYVI